jgi:hypothetical protein
MEGDDLNMQDMTMDSDGAAKPPSPGKEKQP